MVSARDDHVSGEVEAFRSNAGRILERHWAEPGFTMPNAKTYPWQWLWDSCFHAIAWAELGDPDRAISELSALFTFQDSSGFVPHMSYHSDPGASVAFWARRGASTITQPPMFGHALADLHRRGVALPDHLVECAIRGLRFLLRDRSRTSRGLVALAHPWETGCDDSARWDDALDGSWNSDAWRQKKWDLVSSVETNADGAAIANPGFAVGSIGFNALIAFNATELASLTGDRELIAGADELRGVISSLWDPGLRTWTDDGDFAHTSGRVRTLDAHLALLVETNQAVIETAVGDLFDPVAFGSRFGPAGCHRDEPSFDPDTYWRGPTWPQMSYLLWVALNGLGRAGHAQVVAGALRAGSATSGWAEYWNPDTGEGRGATPQSWATIAVAVGPGAMSAQS